MNRPTPWETMGAAIVHPWYWLTITAEFVNGARKTVQIQQVARQSSTTLRTTWIKL
jgi:hypothetical protein